MTYTLPNTRPLTVLVNLFIKCLHLDPAQVKVSGDPMIKSQQVTMFISITDQSTESLGTGASFDSQGNHLFKTNSVWLKNTLLVHAFSKNQEVIDRKEELLLALQSHKAQEDMVKYNMQFQLHSMGTNVSSKYAFKDSYLNCISFPVDVLWTMSSSEEVPYFTPPHNTPITMIR